MHDANGVMLTTYPNNSPQLAVALQKRGDDPELLFCPDEGHGFQKLENRLLFTERMVRFLERTVGK